jgi:creatinine amidohydrolase
MTAVPTGRIDALPWPTVAKSLVGGSLLVLPIGAAAKAHGPHLPLGTDQFVVEALADRLAARLPVLIAPTIGIGYFPAFVEYPASQHISADLFQALLENVMRRFIASGAKNLLLLNNGVSTEGPVIVAAHTIYAETDVRPSVAQLRLFGRDADQHLDDPSGGHADERETSVMLALRPDLVDLSNAAPAPHEKAPSGSGPRFARPVRLANGREPDDGESSFLGATGDPTRATAAKGQAVLAAIEADLMSEIARVFGDTSLPAGTSR